MCRFITQLIYILYGGLNTKLCPTLATPQTLARQAPLSRRFPRQEYWSGLPFPSSGDLSNPGIKLRTHELQGDFCTAGRFFIN